MFFIGLISQGYQCTACGSAFHRICRVFTEVHPSCPGQLLMETQPSTVDSSTLPDADLHQRESKLPTAAPVLKHTYFTVPLDKQVRLLICSY